MFVTLFFAALGRSFSAIVACRAQSYDVFTHLPTLSLLISVAPAVIYNYNLVALKECFLNRNTGMLAPTTIPKMMKAQVNPL